MKAHFLLADSAQAISGKLYLLGGGWSIIGPAPTPMAVAGIIEVPWEEANRKHKVRFELVDEDGHAVMVPTPTGDRPVEVIAEFEVGRPPGTKAGAPFNVPVAMNLGALPLAPDRRFVWRASINGETKEAWRLPFSTRPTTG